MSILKHLTPNLKRTFVFQVLVTFLPMALLTCGAAYYFYYSAQDRATIHNRVREAAGVEIGRNVIGDTLQEIRRDLGLVSGNYALKNFLDRGISKDIQDFEQNTLNLSSSSRLYDQIRWLDETGMERVRVNFNNGNPVITPVESLQKKRIRYYFDAALKLVRGEIYISPLDLNIEHDRIEIPLKPMLRIAEPVFDRHGGKRGIAVLNYFGEDMLTRFAKAIADIANHTMLLNQDGYWLKSPKPDEAWGFMFGFDQLTLARRHPAAWKRILAKDSGPFEDAEGLWTFNTIYPMLDGQKTTEVNTRVDRASFWKVVAHLPPHGLYGSQPFLKHILAALVVLLLLQFAGSWKLARISRLRSEAQVQVLYTNKNLERLVEERTLQLQADIDLRKQVENALQAKEFMLSESQRIAHVGSWKIDLATGNIIWSEETYRIYGVAPETFGHSMEAFYALLHAEDHVTMKAWIGACSAGEHPGELEFRTVRPDGKIRVLSVRGDMHFDDKHQPLHLIGTVQDITERKVAETKIKCLSQLYAALSQCNQAIVRCASEAELLLLICRDAVHFGGFKMVWIGFTDHGTQMVRPVASFGEYASEYLHNIEISSGPDSPFAHNPIGTAIRENQPVWCQDFQNSPVTAPWHERSETFGWSSSASLPIHRNAVAIGAFNLYASEINAFDEAARNLLVEMAMDISFALDNFDRDARRKQAEEALRKNEQRLRAIIETEPECVKIVDCNGQLLEMNAAGLAMLEADSLGEAQQYPLINFVLPEYQAAFATLHKRVMSGESGIVEFEVIGLKGARRWLETHAAPLRDETGNVTMLLSITRDITAHKHADAQLKLAAKVFNQSSEGFMITDAKHNIIMVNHAFTVISGYSEAEVLGQNVQLLSPDQHDRDFYRNILDSIGSEGHWQSEIWNRRKNGEVYPELLNISVARDNFGQITEYIGVFTDISQLKASEAQLEFLAYHDSLTGLPNRLKLFSSLQHGIDMAARENKQLALLMLDLDRFKDVNDSFGHLAGDQLLQLVAERLTGRLRIVDTVARLGGDEFTVLLENIAHPEDAARVAEAIIADLREPLKLPKFGEIIIGVSIGISLYPQHGDTPEILLQQADAALYRAKEGERNRYAYFSDDLTLAARERIKLEARLRRAITENELRVHYQPQVDINSGRIVGAEALVRWQDPKKGLIAPIRFIPVAEQTGLIIALGEWVLRETCRQGRQWIDVGLPPLTLAVNVSPYQFRHGKISDLAAAVLKETGFPADRLELELTESGLMEYQDQAVELLNNLRSQGIRLAIDDFGTGYSSLAYLKSFPPRCVENRQKLY